MNATHLIISHAGCVDGFTAAWAARIALMRKGTPAEAIEVVFAHYGDDAPYVKDRHVIVVDFSYPRETLGRMHQQAASLLVLDHHKTARQELVGLHYCHFDMNRSGSGLAWDVLTNGSPRPELIDYVEDRDLWRFALRNSRAINEYIRHQPKSWETWDRLEGEFYEPYHMRIKGEAMLRVVESYVENALARPPEYIDLLMPDITYHVPCINNTFAVSEVCHALALHYKTPFAVSWFVVGDKRVYSLRGNERDFPDFDVSEVAKHYGGGGHKGAAGFSLHPPARRYL